MLDVQRVRKDFPIFETHPDLVYLDSAATALKPRVMADATNAYYFEYSANASRGLYPLAEAATVALENARKKVADFVHAEEKEAVIFTVNTTHAINMVALGIEERIGPHNNIVVTELEHHSNFLPWKELAKRTGARLRIVPFTETGVIDKEKLMGFIDDHTSVIAFSAVSNVFGMINPVKECVQNIRAKNSNTLIMIDAAQAVGHYPINIQEWDADFIAFSGHKLFGPTGIGVLAGKKSSLEQLSERIVGGGTVLDACSKEVKYKKLPDNLEGGTPNIAGAVGLAAAIDYVGILGIKNIHSHEQKLARYAIEKLQEAFGNKVHILGSMDVEQRAGIVTFALDGVHPHDLAHILGEHGICVRAGEHCASPLHRSLKLPASTRLSFSVYNDEADIDALIKIMKKAHSILRT